VHGYGLDELHAKIPELKRPSIALLVALIAILSFSSATVILETLDCLWPDWTLAFQIAVVALAFNIIAPFFWRREVYKERWGDKAYQNAIALHILTGLPIVFAAIAHIAFMPGKRILFGDLALLAEILAWYMTITGIVLDIRAILVFGFDNLGMLYVYFHEESHMIDSKIYAIIRHPVYSVVIRIGMALALWRGTWASLAFGAFMPFGLTLWLRLVEERELIGRFGARYRDYRRRVPAFVPYPRNIGSFWIFLFTGKLEQI